MKTPMFQEELVHSKRIIYTPSVFARTNLLHLQEVGTLSAIKPHSSHRENLSSFLFFIVQSGSGRIEYQGEEYSVKKSDVILIDCRNSYTHCSSDDLWTLKWIHFNGPNMKSIYEKFSERGGRPVFNTRNPETYCKLVDDIYSIADSSDYIRDMRIFEKLANLVTLLMSYTRYEQKYERLNNTKQNLQSVKDYIDENFDKKITLALLEKQFFINKFYLTKKFKEQFGTTINEYIIYLRITKAKKLLRFSDYTIEKISLICGISDANYFARLFKKVEGITPGEYRKLW